MISSVEGCLPTSIGLVGEDRWGSRNSFMPESNLWGKLIGNSHVCGDLVLQ